MMQQAIKCRALVATNLGGATPSTVKKAGSAHLTWDATNVTTWPKTSAEFQRLNFGQKKALHAAQNKKGYPHWKKGAGPAMKESVCPKCTAFHIGGHSDCQPPFLAKARATNAGSRVIL